MSRSKKRATEELEQLRSENKQLKSTLKAVTRQLTKLNEKPVSVTHEPDKQECPTKNCKGRLSSIDLGNRKMEHCTDCGYRKTYKT